MKTNYFYDLVTVIGKAATDLNIEPIYEAAEAVAEGEINFVISPGEAEALSTPLIKGVLNLMEISRRS